VKTYSLSPLSFTINSLGKIFIPEVFLWVKGAGRRPSVPSPEEVNWWWRPLPEEEGPPRLYWKGVLKCAWVPSSRPGAEGLFF